jgi:chorismate mutase/prephenate dehydrogenase
MDDLDDLRRRIRQTDEQILRLIRGRMDLARHVGELKKSQGVPLRDWQVERAVMEGVESTAAEIGLSPTLARNVLQLLLAESRLHQERGTYSSYTGSTETIVIIGGQGKMGRWFVDFFSNQGHQVKVFDPATPSTSGATLDAALAHSSCAMIATPLEVVPSIIERLIELRYGGIIFDIASLKGHLTPSIDRVRRSGLSITSIHPMFGPSTRILSDQVVCVCDCGDARATQRVRGFFAETAATVVELSLEEHDRIASFVLGLSHLLNVLFARVLMHAGRLAELNRVGSTTFHSQLATSSRVMHENPELYYGIQHLNPYTPHLYAAVMDEWKRLTSAVLEEDMPAFVRLMEEGRRWLDGE